MNLYEILYYAENGSAVKHPVRAETPEEAAAYFTTRTPFVSFGVKFIGPDEDSGQPPVIGPN